MPETDIAQDHDADAPLSPENAGQSSTDPAEGSDETPAPTKDSPQG
ncbi:hypothetical protein [Sphingomonas sp. BAUL-RG-20F-R05-02]|nr:hypothetical protein [Sphingomonas sp. BAUL-RG-20F-R05-02]